MVSPHEKGTFPSSFSFYIEDDIPTLIDTPLTVWFEPFAASLEQRPVHMILNTHFHRDHSGCNHLFPQAKVYAHGDDVPAMVSLESFIRCYGLDSYASPEVAEGLLARLNWHASPIDGLLQEGQIISLGKIDLKVIHTPGHTPGHCAFYWEETGILFSGDIDLTGFGPWYGNTNSDVTQVIQSIKKLIDLNPRMICSGHKGVIDHNIRGQLNKYLERVLDKESRILKALQQPLTLEELVNRRIVYSRWGEPLQHYYFFEKLSILAHLKRLIDMHQVEEHRGKFRATGYTLHRCARL